MALTKPQAAAVKVLLARLDPDSPLFAGSTEVEAALRGTDLRVYLQTWVMPALAFLSGADASSYGYVTRSEFEGDIKRQSDSLQASADGRRRSACPARAQRLRR